MNERIDDTMYMCERVMAEICSEFEEDFGGTWHYEADMNEYSFALLRDGVDMGARLPVDKIHELSVQGVDEVQVFKMFYSAWGKLLPEAYPDLKEAINE